MSNAHLVCVWNTQKTCVPAFSWWVPCTVYGTRKYFFQKNDFKTRSHGTIHTFKNYFVTVFSIFSNKWYPNRPLAFVWIVLKSTCICVSHFFFFLEKRFTCTVGPVQEYKAKLCFSSGSRALFTGPVSTLF